MNLYRYEDKAFAGNTARLMLREYCVLSTTAKGYWIECDLGQRWVSSSSKKRYAHATPEEAFKSYQMRKKRQVEILSARLNYAQACSTLSPDSVSATYGRYLALGRYDDQQ